MKSAVSETHLFVYFEENKEDKTVSDPNSIKYPCHVHNKTFCGVFNSVTTNHYS